MGGQRVCLSGDVHAIKKQFAEMEQMLTAALPPPDPEVETSEYDFAA